MTSNEKEVFWRKHVELQEQSNLTQAQYCKEQNIICSRLVYWRIRFKKGLIKKNSKKTSTDSFIQLGVTKAKPSIITLVLTDGKRLEIPDNLALSLLPELLSAL